MSLPSLNAVQLKFLSAFDVGREAIGQDAKSLFEYFVILEVVLAAIYLALGSREDFANIAHKVLRIGFFSYVIQNYQYLLEVFLQGFLDVGIKATGASGLDVATLQNPDAIVKQAFKIITPAYDKLLVEGDGLLGLPSLDNIIVLFCVSIGFLALVSLALQIFITYIEFMIVSTAGFIFIPFGVFKPLAFMSERIFGAIIAFGIKLLVLAVITGISTNIMSEMALTESLQWQEMWNFLLVSLSLFIVSFHAPGVAQSLLQGHPNLTAAHVGPAIRSTMNGAQSITSKSITTTSLPLKTLAAGAGIAAQSYTSAKSDQTRSTLYGGVSNAIKGAAKGVYKQTLSPAAASLEQSYSGGKLLVPVKPQPKPVPKENKNEGK